MKAALSLVELKELLQAPSKRESWACPSLANGVPRGAITEISGPGKTCFVAEFLRENPTLRVAWIEEHFSVFPFGLQQKKIAPQQVVFIEAGDDMEWVVLQTLRSQSFPVVVMYSEWSDLKALRRIQLATEKADAATLWLTSSEQAFWTSSVQLAVKRNLQTRQLDVRVLRQR